MKSFNDQLDFELDQTFNFVLHKSTSISSLLTTTGQIGFDTTTAVNKIKFFDGTDVRTLIDTIDGNILFGNTLGIDNASNDILNIGATNSIVLNLGRSGSTTNSKGKLLLAADAVDNLGAVTLQQLNSSTTGLWNDRGNFSAAGNIFPASGGSGTAGAILKGNIWTVSTPGTLGGVAVQNGDTVRALVDTPEQTSSNWAIGEHDFGYTPLSNTLPNTNIFVGNASNVATGVAFSLSATPGSFSLDNTGVLTMPDAATSTRGLLNATDWNTFNNKQSALTNPITGTGVSGQVAVWNSSSTETGYSTLQFNSTNGFLGIGGSPSAMLHMQGNISAANWGGAAINLRIDSNTVTDTTSSGAVSGINANVIGVPTFIASSSTTYTNINNVFIGNPITSTNVTGTNIWALALGGNLNFNGGSSLAKINSNSGTLTLQTAQTDRIIIGSTGLNGIGTGTPTALLDINGNGSILNSTDWGTSGIGIRQRAITYTNTTSSGTQALIYINNLAAPIIAASSATTFTEAYTLNIEPPAAGSGSTLTFNRALRLGGGMMALGNLLLSGATRNVGLFDANQLNFITNNTARISITSTGLQTLTQDALSSGTTPFITYTQPAHTGGAQPGFLWTAGALTSQTTATEVTDINYNLSAVMKMVDGTVALQRAFIIQGRTYTPQTTALTITTPITLDVAPPIAGSGTTFTNGPYAIRSQGNILISGGTKFDFTTGGTVGIGTTDNNIFNLKTGNTTRLSIGTQGTIVHSGTAQVTSQIFFKSTQPDNTGGVSNGWQFIGGTLTGQTASTEVIDFNINNTAIKTWANGAITTQRDNLIQHRTYAHASGSNTITTAATLAITNAPQTTGGFTTITEPLAWWVQAGNTRLDGNLKLGTAGNRLFIAEGAGTGFVGQTTLVSGTKVITIAGLTTSSRAYPGFVSQGGTSTGVFQYSMVCTANTLTITAVTAAGVTVATDTSIVNYFIIN